MAQFLRTREVEAAPRRVLGAVTALGENVGKSLFGGGVVRGGEHRVFEQFGGVPQVTFACELGALCDDDVYADEGLDVAGGLGLRWMLPQRSGVSVEPSEVALVDRFDVVADRTVVAARGPRIS